MTTPSWLHKYVPTAASRRQNIVMLLDLMVDQVFDASVAAVSDLYRRLCAKRDAIDE